MCAIPCHPPPGPRARRCIPCTNAPRGPGAYYTSPGAPTPFDNNCSWACAAGYARAAVEVRDAAGCLLAVREQCVPAP